MKTASWPSRLEQRLSRHPTRALRPSSSGGAAAVLVVLLETAGVPDVLLERRADHLARHAGQFALPGGRIDEADHGPEGAALREAEEETGLSANRVTLLGRLSDQRTSTGWVITPVVGSARDPGLLKPDAGEVAELLRVPVTAVVGERGFRFVVHRQRGLRITDLALAWQGRNVWGATARILRELGRVLVDVGGPWS